MYRFPCVDGSVWRILIGAYAGSVNTTHLLQGLQYWKGYFALKQISQRMDTIMMQSH